MAVGGEDGATSIAAGGGAFFSGLVWVGLVIIATSDAAGSSKSSRFGGVVIKFSLGGSIGLGSASNPRLLLVDLGAELEESSFVWWLGVRTSSSGSNPNSSGNLGIVAFGENQGWFNSSCTVGRFCGSRSKHACKNDKSCGEQFEGRGG